MTIEAEQSTADNDRLNERLLDKSKVIYQLQQQNDDLTAKHEKQNEIIIRQRNALRDRNAQVIQQLTELNNKVNNLFNC